MKDRTILSEGSLVAYMEGDVVYKAGLGREKGEHFPSYDIQITEEGKKDCGGKIISHAAQYTSRMTKPYPWNFPHNHFNRSLQFEVNLTIM